MKLILGNNWRGWGKGEQKARNSGRVGSSEDVLISRDKLKLNCSETKETIPLISALQ